VPPIAATLYSLSVSHPSLAVHCMLERKRIDHRVIDLIPGMHPVPLRALRFPRNTVPALLIDGRRIQGSREISRALDEVVPEPPLFPRAPDERKRVEDAERWGEQVFQGVPRRIFRWMTVQHYETRRWLADDAGIPLGSVIARPTLQARVFARSAGADADTVRADLAGLGSLVAEVERLRADNVIGGEGPNAADFQIATTLRSLASFGDLEPFVADHPAFRWAATVVPPLPGPVPPGLPREWLAPMSSWTGRGHSLV
jgi:glutathione S-transferase